MKAMVLAAGLGTRLRPLTNDRPKALVEVNGHTLLEITLCRLRQFGVTEVVINVHHFAAKMLEYLQTHNFGVNIQISHEEDQLLDTGGGIKRAAPLLAAGLAPDDVVIVHNVDVISNIDLKKMIDGHRESGAIATLAVQDRKTSRYLLFDSGMRLCGRKAGADAKEEVVEPADSLTPLAFCGIHVISAATLGLIQQNGPFSIIETYLDLVRRGNRIQGYRCDRYFWRDLGKPENIRQAAEDIAHDPGIVGNLFSS